MNGRIDTVFSAETIIIIEIFKKLYLPIEIYTSILESDSVILDSDSYIFDSDSYILYSDYYVLDSDSIILQIHVLAVTMLLSPVGELGFKKTCL